MVKEKFKFILTTIPTIIKDINIGIAINANVLFLKVQCILSWYLTEKHCTSVNAAKIIPKYCGATCKSVNKLFS